MSRIGSLEDIELEIDSDLSIEAADFMEDFNFGLPLIPNTEPFSVEDTDQLISPIWKDMEF